jgi:hypothetical protein
VYKGSFCPVSLETFVVGGVLDARLAILTGVRWNLSVALICSYFMARGGENFFMCFLATWTCSLKKFCLVQLPTSSLVP